MPDLPPRNPVTANVRAEMARRGETQQSLADRIGMKQQGLSRRLRGETRFTVDELQRIADALEVRAAELLGATA
jgi:transcriptional regulator with XRE-family HTH domain